MSFNYIYKYKDRLIPYGFTGHEMLDDFELINMNGRMYDPIVCRFLSPDPYIQMPDNTQSYNRYSYCMNNPLTMTDPSGYNWLPWTMAADFLSGGTISRTAAFAGGFASITGITTGSAVFSSVTAFIPPTLGATVTFTNTHPLLLFANSLINSEQNVNTNKIFDGIFMTDVHLSDRERIWQLISRFTWEYPQTQIGYSGSQIHNLLGGVKSVNYYGGATVVESYAKFGAVTLGNIIIGSRNIEAKPTNSTFQHEFGHYLQSQVSGIYYLPHYGIPSFIDATSTHVHDRFVVEQDANIRAFKYFNKHESNFTYFDNTSGEWKSDWKFWINPIIEYNSSLGVDSEINRKALNGGSMYFNWYDIFFPIMYY